MNAISKSAMAAAIGSLGLLGTIGAASAAVVCSGNVCWHTRETYRYPPRAHIVIHPDTWRWGPHVVIREHEGRGYWRGDTWTPF